MQNNEENIEYDGYVDTVLGPKEKCQLGITLTHEHLVGNFSKLYKESSKYVIFDPQCDITSSSFKQFGHINQFSYRCKNNLLLDDTITQTAMMKEVATFKQFNGGTIVEKSSCLNRNIGFLKSLSKHTKVNIIIGTGYHIADTKNLLTSTMTIEKMYYSINNEFINGCQGYPDVRPAFIADSGDITLDFEKHALRAIGELQEQYCYPVSFHPGQRAIPLEEVMRIYQEAGGRPTEFVMCHIDRSFRTKEDLMEFVDETKCYIQFDQFGVMSSFYQLDPFTDVLSDTQRIRLIALLKTENKLRRILISHDIHTKHRLLAFGGLGFSYISEIIEPLMSYRHLNLENIKEIRVDNPFKWLRRINKSILV